MRAVLTDVSKREEGVQPTRVQRVYGDLRPYGTINDLDVFVLELRNDKPGRNKDDTSLAGLPGKGVDDILESAESYAALVLTCYSMHRH